MKVTYDSSVDAAYICLIGELAAGSVKKTYACDPAEVGAIINLDFDKEDRIVGIEVLGASKHLPKAMLKGASLI